MRSVANAPRLASPTSAYAWAAIAAAAMSVGATVFSLVLSSAQVQRYPDFVVGHLAWAGESKVADLWSVPLGLAAALVTAFVLHRVALKLIERGGSDALRTFASQLLLCSAPAAAAAARLFYRFSLDVAPLHLSTAAVLILAATVALGLRRGPFDPRIAGYAVLGLLLVSLLPVEWGVLRSRVFEGTAGADGIGTFAVALFGLGAAFLIGASALAPSRVHLYAACAIAVGSAGLPVLFLLLYPSRFTLPSGELFTYPSTASLSIAIGVLAAWAWWDIGRRVLLPRRLAGADPASVLSPVAFFALVVALRYGQTIIPSVPSDDFHFGERLLGWWTTLRFHALPFVDYAPLHGLLEDDVGGYLSSLFFDGSAATIGESDRLMLVGLALATYMAMLRVTGSVALAFAAALMLGGRAAWFALAVLFCLAADASLSARPARWLTAWLVAAPLVVFAVPAQGVIAMAATAPLAFYAAFRWWTSGAPRLRSWPVAAFVALAVAAVATPFGAMLFGALRYLVDFGPVNQVAYAIPWQVSLLPEAHPTFVAELVRMSWIAIPIVAAALLAFFPRGDARRPTVVATALPALLFSVALVPYTMGRIDPSGISRPGVVAVLGWSIFVPLMVWAAVGARAVPAAVLVAALGAGALGGTPMLLPLAHAGESRSFADDPRKAVAAGLESMGMGRTDDRHRARLLKLKATLDALVPPGETYLDLTGHTADYFYLQRPPALRVSAPYNLVPVREQGRAIDTLSRAPPSVALLEAGNLDFDGGTLALRAPLMFRFVLDTYQPYERDGVVLGRLRDGARGVPRLAESELALLDRIYAMRHLQWIPVSWGRSLDTLARKMDPVAVALDESPHSLHDLAADGTSLRVVGPDPFLSYDVSARLIEPPQAGLLKFDFACTKRTAQPRLQLFFWGDAEGGPTESGSFYFNAADGTMIVPLDAYPRYLNLATLRGLRFDLDNAEACSAISIRNVGLYQRHSVLDYARAASRAR
jgi:hypothetical protein